MWLSLGVISLRTLAGYFLYILLSISMQSLEQDSTNFSEWIENASQCPIISALVLLTTVRVQAQVDIVKVASEWEVLSSLSEGYAYRSPNSLTWTWIENMIKFKRLLMITLSSVSSLTTSVVTLYFITCLAPGASVYYHSSTLHVACIRYASIPSTNYTRNGEPSEEVRSIKDYEWRSRVRSMAVVDSLPAIFPRFMVSR